MLFHYCITNRKQYTNSLTNSFFGLVKRYTSVSTLLVIVTSSSVGGHNIPQPTVNCCTGERYVFWYSWSEYLSRFFRPLPGIHHVRFDMSAPGMCFTTDSEESAHNLLVHEGMCASEMPSSYGMSLERQQYLYDRTRRPQSKRVN